MNRSTTRISCKAVAAMAMLLAATSVTLAQDAKVQEKTFAVSGATGIELYESIGRNGPNQAIAQTSYRLQWFRSYERNDGGCRLSKLRPDLTIIYTYPKPSKRLQGTIGKRWDTFIAGVRKHEEVHGAMIRSFVAEAKTTITGTGFDGDANCAKVKQAVTRRLAEAADGYKQRSRDFDRRDLVDGGNVHSLILALVNER